MILPKYKLDEFIFLVKNCSFTLVDDITHQILYHKHIYQILDFDILSKFYVTSITTDLLYSGNIFIYVKEIDKCTN